MKSDITAIAQLLRPFEEILVLKPRIATKFASKHSAATRTKDRRKSRWGFRRGSSSKASIFSGFGSFQACPGLEPSPLQCLDGCRPWPALSPPPPLPRVTKTQHRGETPSHLVKRVFGFEGKTKWQEWAFRRVLRAFGRKISSATVRGNRP